MKARCRARAGEWRDRCGGPCVRRRGPSRRLSEREARHYAEEMADDYYQQALAELHATGVENQAQDECAQLKCPDAQWFRFEFQ